MAPGKQSGTNAHPQASGGSNVYQYDDYRAFLRDKFSEKKAASPTYSCRVFAREAGFANPGFLNEVIKGRRGLSDDAVGKMIAVFGLGAAEAEYFRLIVEYAQCKDSDEKQQLYRKIVFRRNRSAFARLNPALSRYYQDHRYPLVRTAIMACDFRGDYEKLGHFLFPAMAANQVKKYVRDLCEWGLVVQEADGGYRVTETFIEPPSSLREQIRQVNRAWIEQGIDALMNLPPEKRHISSMLLCVGPRLAGDIAARVERFREEIWQMVKNDREKGTCMMLLNMQYIPKSRNGKEDA